MSNCSPSPVASKAWHDSSAKWGSRVTYLGIVGDQAHSVRISGHNCGAFQESGLTNPANGVFTNYPDAYAHALDIGHGSNRALATEIRNAFLNDPFKRVRYVIDNGVIYYPEWRGGGTGSGSGHESHVHVSFTPWSTHDVRPFFAPAEPVFPLQRGDKNSFPVLLLEIHLVHAGYENVVVDGNFGPQTSVAVKKMQKFLHRPVTGKVTERDFEAITNWIDWVEDPADRDAIKTLSDRGPRIGQLRKDLHKIGQRVPPHGNLYDEKVQVAVQNVQRFFDSPHKAGNASAEDRKFIRQLADEA